MFLKRIFRNKKLNRSIKPHVFSRYKVLVKSFPKPRHFSTFYQKMFEESKISPAHFWKEQSKMIDWTVSPTSILPSENPSPSSSESWKNLWFADGKLNACHNAVDRHVHNGHGNTPALLWHSGYHNTSHSLSYSELHSLVNRAAAGLRALGFTKGDVVLLYAPMILETAILTLAAARLGLIYTHVFAGFAPHELATRISDCKPKAIFFGSSGLEKDRIIPFAPLLKEALKLSHHSPSISVCIERKTAGFMYDPSENLISNGKFTEISFDQLMKLSSKTIEPISVESSHPLYILYTSGTTGKPKGVVRDTGGYLTSLRFSMKYIFNTNPKDVFWAASDFGWVVGQSYTLWAPLLTGATSIIFEGKPIIPDPGVYWRVISEHKVKNLFCAPTALRAIKKVDPEGNFIRSTNLENLKSIFLAGERADIPSLEWAQSNLPGKNILDHWWMTETGWPITGPFWENEKLCFPPKFGAAGKVIPGNHLLCLSDHSHPSPPNTQGHLFLRKPMAPGNLIGLWTHPKRFEAYFKNHNDFDTGDMGFIDEENYVSIMSRTDDIINVAGHRLSTGSIESCLNSHGRIAESAVIAIPDEIKGEIPFAFVVLNEKKSKTPVSEDSIKEELFSLVRTHLGAIYCFHNCMIVKALPKTRSGKITRASLKKLVTTGELVIPSTIEDASVFEPIQVQLKNFQFKH